MDSKSRDSIGHQFAPVFTPHTPIIISDDALSTTISIISSPLGKTHSHGSGARSRRGDSVSSKDKVQALALSVSPKPAPKSARSSCASASSVDFSLRKLSSSSNAATGTLGLVTGVGGQAGEGAKPSNTPPVRSKFKDRTGDLEGKRQSASADELGSPGVSLRDATDTNTTTTTTSSNTAPSSSPTRRKNSLTNLLRLSPGVKATVVGGGNGNSGAGSSSKGRRLSFLKALFGKQSKDGGQQQRGLGAVAKFSFEDFAEVQEVCVDVC